MPKGCTSEPGEGEQAGDVQNLGGPRGQLTVRWPR